MDYHSAIHSLKNHTGIVRLRQVTIPYAYNFIKMVEDENRCEETKILINNYCSYVLNVTLASLSGFPIPSSKSLIYCPLFSATMYVKGTALTLTYLRDLTPGVYLLEVSVRNKDGDCNQPCFLQAVLDKDNLSEQVHIFHHRPALSCHGYTLIVPLMLFIVKEGEKIEELQVILNHSSHIAITALSLVSLRHRVGKWIDVTQ